MKYKVNGLWVWESLLYRGWHGRFLLGNDFDLSPEDPEKATQQKLHWRTPHPKKMGMENAKA